MALRDLVLMVGACLVWAANSVLFKIVIADFAFGPRMAMGTAVAHAGVPMIALRRNHVIPPLFLMRD